MDGGWNAISGFLNQVIVGLGLQAWGSEFMRNSPDDPELAMLLTLSLSAGVHHERFDADVALVSFDVSDDSKCTLVQIKYSRRAPPSTIHPQELKKIAEALDKAKDKAETRGLEVDGFFLVSNRPLSAGSEELIEAIRSKSRDPLPDPVTDLCQVDILEQLKIVKIHQSEWLKKLKEFASSYGCLPRDTERGVNNLIGKVHREIAENGTAQVEMHDLVWAFTECQGANPLNPESIVERSTQDVRELLNRYPRSMLRRRLLDALAEAIAEQHALVVLAGEGGCGKSVALHQWALELVTSKPPTATAFSALTDAEHVEPNWIARVISCWARLPTVHDRFSEEHSYALTRLEAANPDLGPPIMYLGLDDVSENCASSEKVAILRDLVCWFWNEERRSRQESRPPRAVLVVTCRDYEQLLEDHLRLDGSGYQDYKGMRKPYSVSVEIFTPQELLQAAFETRNADLYSRIQATCAPSGGLCAPKSIGRPVSASAMDRAVVSSAVFSALLHPAMWGSLLILSAELQSSALDGDRQALHQMARIFVGRFCVMARRRNQAANLTKDELFAVLQIVARKCDSTVKHSRKDWIEPVRSFGLGELAATKLHHEALSGGLIVRDGVNWYWRHGLVWDYLANSCASPVNAECEGRW